jgi:predicted dehydrogenase
MSRQVSAIIVGAGHRGVGYGSYSLSHPDELKIVGVADPDDVRREKARAKFDLPAESCFRTAEELAQRPKFADAVINGTMDRQHVPTTLPLLDAGYDVLLEKPICPTREELLTLLHAVRRTGRRLMIGHVLRYAPFYVAIKKRVLAGDIGEIMSINTTERVSYHHMAVAFVRGKWNRREINPMLLAKCCHDLDLVAWFKSGVAPTQVASFGHLSYFKPEHAPEGAGLRCLVDCKIEADCRYSCRKHYIEQKRWGAYAWESIEHIPSPTEEDKLQSLRTDNPYGRCVWHCGNDVVDHQSVIVDFADDTTAAHTMVCGTAKPCRTLHLVGTHGEIEGEMEAGRFVVRHPDARAGHEFSEELVDLSVTGDGHGGGDMRLVGDFVSVVRGDEPSISTTTVEDSVYGHLVAFAADDAMTAGKVVRIEELGG